MQFLSDLAVYSVPLFSLALLITQLMAREVGYAVGHRRAPLEKGADDGAGMIVGSVLGLVAFVLALTLNFAVARQAERRIGALEEANAISTAWLQASAIGDPRANAAADRLVDYVAVRRSYAAAGRDDPALLELGAQSAALQSAIWTDVAALSAERRDPATTSLMNAVNNVFDLSTAQSFTLATRLPQRLVALLYASALLGMAMLGYRLGLVRSPQRALSVIMAVAWTAVVVQILDFGSPRVGFYRTDLQVYDWTEAGMRPAALPGG